MGVDVHESRRDQGPVGADLPPAGTVDRAHLHDDAVPDGHVRRPPRIAGAVDHRAAANHQLVLVHIHASRTSRQPPDSRISPRLVYNARFSSAGTQR